MTTDTAQLRGLYVWPQSIADHHADILTPRQIKELYKVGEVACAAADELDRLRAELVQANAGLVHQAKLIDRLDTTIHHIVAKFEDEGDRVYLGSTNDADALRALSDDLSSARFEGAKSHKDGRDLYAEMRELRAERDEARQAWKDATEGWEMAQTGWEAARRGLEEVQADLSEERHAHNKTQFDLAQARKERGPCTCCDCGKTMPFEEGAFICHPCTGAD